MRVGINTAVVSGQIVSDLSWGQTSSGIPACNFRLRVPGQSGRPTFLTANAYNALVNVIRDLDLKKGDEVAIEGQLISREIEEGKTVLELRIVKLFLLQRKPKEQDKGV